MASHQRQPIRQPVGLATRHLGRHGRRIRPGHPHQPTKMGTTRIPPRNRHIRPGRHNLDTSQQRVGTHHQPPPSNTVGRPLRTVPAHERNPMGTIHGKTPCRRPQRSIKQPQGLQAMNEQDRLAKNARIRETWHATRRCRTAMKCVTYQLNYSQSADPLPIAKTDKD